MRKLSFLMLLICSGIVFGQMRAVSQKVQDLNTTRQDFKAYDLFTKDMNTQKSAKYLDAVTNVTVLEINTDNLQKIVNEAPEFLSLKVPYENELVDLQLYKNEVLTDSFHATDEQGRLLNYTPGQYYRGIVNGDYNSIVAVSFFNDNVIGIISTDAHGNMVLGKSTDGQDYITYSENDLVTHNPFVCGVDELEYNHPIMDNMDFDPSVEAMPETDKCVRIYYEITRSVFNKKGRNIEATLDWITGIHNNIATLYDNDGIDITMSSVKIWTIPDPYTLSYGDNLSLFAASTSDFDGDLAHLVNTPSTTSVAYLNSLCEGANYAYSAVNMLYSEVPTYSWTVGAMTHEMGHSMGSPHTHACFWNGNNTAIDGCGPAGGANEGCNAPIPEDGGTIMSYCHLVSVGVNFNKGFGDQPGQHIRNTVNSKPCLGDECTTGVSTCLYSIESVDLMAQTNTTAQLLIDDEYSTLWDYQAVLFGEPLTEEGWTETESTEINLSDLQPNKYYEIFVRNKCESGLIGTTFRTIILTGDFCDGTPFTDTGGTTGSYSSNEYFVKTFYPYSPTGKVTLSFDKIGLETNRDYMYVYNGDSISSPLFEGGEITGNNNPGPTFVSTHSTGAITVKFESSRSLNLYGWEGSVDCGLLNTVEMEDNAGVSVYPNPTTDVLNIISQKENIESVKLTDALGRNVMTKSLSERSTQLSIGHLPKGVYILTIKLKEQTVNKKVIRR
ncbi:MAG: T9SS type A sorting domain-containing protein [Weeksellaceae bacterium]